jgi:hypothetical protein
MERGMRSAEQPAGREGKPTKATQCDIKATLKRVDSQGIATLKPP